MPKTRNKSETSKPAAKRRNWFFFGIIGGSFFCTIFLQTYEETGSSGLKIFGSGSSSEVPRLEFSGNPVQSLFLIVPFRNRMENRKVFVSEMRRFLQKKVRSRFPTLNKL